MEFVDTFFSTEYYFLDKFYLRRQVMSFSGGGITLGPGEGKTINMPGMSITFKAMKEDTGGAYSLLEAIVTGDGPPQHIHKTEEEAFYVLEGEINIQMGDQTIRGTAGSFVLVPRGTVHTFWNAGSTPAKLLGIFSPPGLEQFFIEVVGEGEEEIDAATRIERGMAVAQKYNLEVVGPPLG
jgi:mannose-6-phosphate isomerase-like protein (cupin superfamily)